MANYRLEDVNTQLDELDGKYVTTITAPGGWTPTVDPYYGSCYYTQINHNFGSATWAHNVEVFDPGDGYSLQPLAIKFVDQNNINIIMPVNTVTIEVVIN